MDEWDRLRRHGMSPFELEEEDAQSTQAWAGGLFLLLAAALVLWNLYQAMEMSNSEGWSKTTGRIVACGTAPGPGFLANHLTYPEVSYTYKVREQLFKSSQLHWASNFRLTRAGAEQEAARYPAGAEVIFRCGLMCGKPALTADKKMVGHVGTRPPNTTVFQK